MNVEATVSEVKMIQWVETCDQYVNNSLIIEQNKNCVERNRSLEH
jgi:hypothetical protein